MSYDKHTWETNEAITKEKLNNIENGIASIETQITNKGTDISTLDTKVESYNNTIWAGLGFQAVDLSTQNTTIAGRLQSLWTTINNSSTSSLRTDLDAVIEQVNEARRVPGSDNPSQWPDLVDVLTGMKQTTAQVSDVADGAATSATSANNKLDSLIEGLKGTYLTPKAHIDAIDSNIDDVEDDIQDIKDYLDKPTTSTAAANTLLQEIVDAHRTTSDTLDNRFDALDTQMGSILGNGNDTLQTQLTNVKTEVEAARVSTANGNATYTTLDDRLEADETNIGALQTEVGAAHRSGVQNDTLDNRFDDIETELTGAKDTYNSIDARFDAVETTANAAAVASEVTSALNGLDTRLDAIDGETTPTRTLPNVISEIDTAHREHSGHFEEDEETHERVEINDTLNLRFDDIESNLSTINSDLNTAETGLKAKVNTLETNVGSISDSIGTGFDSTNTIAAAIVSKANSSALNTKADASIVNAISTTIVVDKTKVDFDTDNRTPISFKNDSGITLNDKDDYLIQENTDDGKYYYWKHINNAWHLMGGAGNGEGGGGNTSGMDLTRVQYNNLLSDQKVENTDYYVRESNGLVRHYRYVMIGNTLTEIEIGTLASNIKRYNLSYGTQKQTIDNVETDVNYLYLHEFAYGEDNDEPESDTIITSIPLPSGGGGSGIISSQKITRITSRAITQPLGSDSPVVVQFFYTSGVAGDGAVGQMYLDDTLIIDNISITSGDPSDASTSWPSGNSVPDGFYSVDLSSYCTTLGVKHFRIVITDIDEPTLWKDMKWDVDVMNLTLSSDFTEHSINNLGSTVRFTYIANGDIDKVANFQLNETLLPTVNLSKDTDGQSQNYTIPAQSIAGTYRLKVWLTATANGRTLPPSEPIYRDLIWRDSTSSDVIIACKYRDNVNEPMIQYDTLEIPYTIVGGTIPYTVNYYVDNMNEAVNQVTLTGNAGIWKYHANQDGTHTLKIRCQGQEVSFTINVEQSEKDISPVTDNLVLDFNPQGMSNTSNRRLWTNGTYSMTVSNNFDWYNGGYGSDDSGDYFLVKAGTRAIFDYKMFVSAEVENSIVNSVFETGKEFKITFKTNAVRNVDAIWFTNMGPSSSSENAKQVGIQLNAHNGFLKTNSASNVAVNGVEATNTYLYFPYSEEDKIELDININQASENNNFIMSYEDGCPSKAYPYSTSEILYHVSGQEANITIGSDDCDVYIYRMRIYDAELSTEDVLRNFIADGKDSAESIERYNRNSIYYDTKKKEFVPYIGTNTVLDPERLATKIPDVKVLMLETPKFTENKKDFVPYSSLRCIHAPGGKYFKSRGKEDNWLFQNGYHAGQGTTSDKYGNAARNLDFLFMCDGIHNPSDKVSIKNENFLPGYQSSLILGYGTDEQEDPTYCLDWKDQDTWAPNTAYALTDNGHDTLVRYNGQVYKCIEAHTSDSTFDSDKWEVQEGYTSKVTLTSTSIPNNFFNLKVNIASSENANNMLLQKRYNDFLPYVSPAKLRDARIKNDMEFVPAIIFIKETGSATVNGETVTYTRQAFNDSEWHFYALGNIGDSKKTDYTRAYDPQDMNEFTLEISDNNTNNSQFQSGVYMASFYRIVSSPVVDDIENYYELTNNGKFGTVQYNSETQYYGNFIKTPDTELNNEKTYYAFIEKRRFIEPYTVEEDFDDKGKSKGTYTARSSAGEAIQPISYLFPIDYATEWAALNNNNEPINMRYWSLTQEKFDGDHSFEMRYACQGNYRDGKLVNDTHGKITVNGEQVSKDKYQVETINTEVWRAFYTWLITSTDEQFVAELEEWCVRSSVAYFYAFTHYYTMMDNRAKNTFWHFAKTGKYRRVSRPVEALLHVYEEAQGTVTEDAQYAGVWNGTFAPTTDTSINSQKTYYTQYAFDMWVYDTDTALGIDNNGELVFPYGKEDGDFRIDGDPSSSYVFNGAGSIFWRRLRDNFTEAIRSIFTGNRMNECFNADTLIEEFDKYQSCFPEAIWRLDVERKYIRSFTGDTENGTAITTKETRFLRDMMQGRKKYQRRQWAKDQDIYFGSKYMLPIVGNDFFEFSCYNPGGQAVTPNWDLTIIPYQDMYINISYAETFASPFRAKAGVMYEFKSILNDMNDSRIRVFGANHIQMLAGKAKHEDPNDPEKITGADGLASFYIKANNFEHGKKLRKLILGSDNINYVNGNFTTFNHANNYPILEELNLKNCGNLGGALDLSQSTALKIIEAQGTQISQVLLPGSTGITTLHLPETITKIELKSAKQLTDLTINNRAGTQDLTSLTQLDIDDSDYSNTINWLTLASTALNHLDLVSLLNLSTSSIVNIDELEPFKLRKDTISRVYLSGIINVTGNWSQTKIDTYRSIWHSPELNFNTNSDNEIIEYKLTFYLSLEDQINHNPYYISYLSVEEGALDTVLGDDPAYINLCPIPQKASTVSKSYFFGANKNQYLPWSGWRFINSDSTPRADLTIDEDMELVAVFGEEARTYPLRWYLNEDDAENNYVYEVLNVPYNSSYETGLAPSVLDLLATSKTTAQLNPDANHTYKIFKGWKKQPNNLDSTYLNNNQTAFCIYGDWEEGTQSISSIKTQAQLDEKKLLVLTNTNDSPSILPTSSTYTVEMGYDNSTGTTIVGKNASLGIGPRGNAYTGESIESPILSFEWYNGGIVPTIRPVNDIKPFTNMSTDGFTLAIDYQVDTTYARSVFSSGYCIIGGCYFNDTANNIAQGFALYYDVSSDVIKVCFGNLSIQNTYSSSTSSRAITNPVSANKRNIVVIRHKPGSNTLQFYSGISATNGILLSLDDDSFRQEITWSNNNMTSPLCFGHFTTSTFSALAAVHPGVGASIHWAKYWDQDLGHNECTLLASWPHESITFGLSDYSNDGTRDILVTNSKNLIFSALQLSQYSGPVMQSIQLNPGNTVSWGNVLKSNSNSMYKQIANQRFFLGLPIKLQAIASKTIGQAALITDNHNFNHVYEYTTSNETVDLAFLPTYYEVGGDREDYQSEALRSLPWYTAANTKIFSYGTSNFDFSTYTNNTQYMNLRFFGVPIKSTSSENNIFIGYTGSDPVYNKINIQNNPNGGITRGDIFIYTYTSNNSTTTVAYIYANELDKAAGAPIVKASQGDLLYCESGGWIPAGSWWTRTPADTNEERAVGSQPFFYIDGNTGAISYNSTPAENGAYFVYEFGI